MRKVRISFRCIKLGQYPTPRVHPTQAVEHDFDCWPNNDALPVRSFAGRGAPSLRQRSERRLQLPGAGIDWRGIGLAFSWAHV